MNRMANLKTVGDGRNLCIKEKEKKVSTYE